MRTASKVFFWLGLLSLLTGLVAGGLAVWAGVGAADSLSGGAVQFDAPGPRTVHVDRPGPVIVFTDAPELAPSQVLVTDPTGRTVAVTLGSHGTAAPSPTVSSPANQRRTSATFDAASAGDYTVTVRLAGAHVIVAPNLASNVGGLVGAGIGAIVAIVTIGFTAVAWLLALILRLAAPTSQPAGYLGQPYGGGYPGPPRS